MNQLGRFKALLLLSLSTFGFKSYAEVIYKKTLADVGGSDAGRVSYFNSQSKSGESSGNWTVQKEMTTLSSGNWTLEQKHKVSSGNWTMMDTKDLLSNGNWTSSSPVKYSNQIETLILEEIRHSDEWTKIELNELIESGNFSIKIDVVE